MPRNCNDLATFQTGAHQLLLAHQLTLRVSSYAADLVACLQVKEGTDPPAATMRARQARVDVAAPQVLPTHQKHIYRKRRPSVIAEALLRAGTVDRAVFDRSMNFSRRSLACSFVGAPVRGRFRSGHRRDVATGYVFPAAGSAGQMRRSSMYRPWTSSAPLPVGGGVSSTIGERAVITLYSFGPGFGLPIPVRLLRKSKRS